MPTEPPPMPATDLPGYLRAYAREMTGDAEDPATVLDRYHTPDLAWFNDGLLLDRERLLTHAAGVRRRGFDSATFEIHGHTVRGELVGAHYTLTSRDGRDRQIGTEIFMLGTLAPDGRLRRIDQVTRVVPTDPG